MFSEQANFFCGKKEILWNRAINFKDDEIDKFKKFIEAVPMDEFLSNDISVQEKIAIFQEENLFNFLIVFFSIYSKDSAATYKKTLTKIQKLCFSFNLKTSHDFFSLFFAINLHFFSLFSKKMKEKMELFELRTLFCNVYEMETPGRRKQITDYYY